MWYTLNAHEQPVPTQDYGLIDRHLDRTKRIWPDMRDNIEGYRVSTVFMGLDHGYGDGPPILWETMIFDDAGGGALNDDEYQTRYTSADAARAGHQRAIDWLRARIAATGDGRG